MNCTKCNYPFPGHELRNGLCLDCTAKELKRAQNREEVLRLALFQLQADVKPLVNALVLSERWHNGENVDISDADLAVGAAIKHAKEKRLL